MQLHVHQISNSDMIGRCCSMHYEFIGLFIRKRYLGEKAPNTAWQNSVRPNPWVHITCACWGIVGTGDCTLRCKAVSFIINQALNCTMKSPTKLDWVENIIMSCQTIQCCPNMAWIIGHKNDELWFEQRKGEFSFYHQVSNLLWKWQR